MCSKHIVKQKNSSCPGCLCPKTCTSKFRRKVLTRRRVRVLQVRSSPPTPAETSVSPVGLWAKAVTPQAPTRLCASGSAHMGSRRALRWKHRTLPSEKPTRRQLSRSRTAVAAPAPRIMERPMIAPACKPGASVYKKKTAVGRNHGMRTASWRHMQQLQGVLCRGGSLIRSLYPSTLTLLLQSICIPSSMMVGNSHTSASHSDSIPSALQAANVLLSGAKEMPATSLGVPFTTRVCTRPWPADCCTRRYRLPVRVAAT